MAKKFRYKHISSVIEDRVPASLLDGEIAVNRFAGKEKLFIKNSEDDIISFAPEHVITELSGNLNTLAIATDREFDEFYDDIDVLSATVVACVTRAQENEITDVIMNGSGMTISGGVLDLGNVMTDENEYVITTAINDLTDEIDDMESSITELNNRIGDIESILASI